MEEGKGGLDLDGSHQLRSTLLYDTYYVSVACYCEAVASLLLLVMSCSPLKINCKWKLARYFLLVTGPRSWQPQQKVRTEGVQAYRVPPEVREVA